MEKNKRLDVESLRNPFESNTEWRMRRSFLDVHADKFPLDRLICLSNCYVNVEMYGCRYPELVMKQLRELEKDIPEYVPLKKALFNQTEDILVKTTSRKKGVQMMNFVKAGPEENWSASLGKSTGNQTVDKKRNQTSDLFHDLVNPKDIKSSHYQTVSKRMGLGFEKTSQSSSTGVKTKEGDRIMINQKFQDLSRKISQYRGQKVQGRTMNSVELLYMVGSKCQMTVSNKIEPATLENGGAGFACELFIDCVSVTTGHGSKKKTAKEDACEKAVDIFSRSSLSVVENESGNLKVLHADTGNIPALPPDIGTRTNVKPYMKSQNEISMRLNLSHTDFAGPSFTSQTGAQLMGTFQPMGVMHSSHSHYQQKKRKRDCQEACSDPSKFILIYRDEDPILSSMKRIADFNKVEINYRSEATGSGWRCETYFGEFLMADGVGIDEKEARINSAERALAALKEICWSLKEKQRADTDETAMTKDDLLADLQAGEGALPDSNIGNMLLRKMGWTGGGVGKEGNKGIAEPVSVRQVVNRQGLGLMSSQGTPKDFYNKMNRFASDYIQSDNQSDIVFSPEFTKEERAVIHQVCKKFNLKATSRGTGEDRYLTMGRKRNALQLLDYVMSKGGSTQKYEVIPPSGLSLSGVLDTYN
ncbi:hypothetical protein CHS0354_013610 [Potamilus streckersoni]|uniref:NF-kappa-B-repressing factor n=1 Tax=Potamilus streckersoni TaxID=2493646 RepID=A0AAE0VX05_9BIVA|nr:hypothetical protein CHS0354_013610 [Potamilus streckersoni]